MRDAPKASRKHTPANDNQRPRPVRAVVNVAKSLPIQLVEIEVFAELLGSLPEAANDNEAGQ
jgi:enamine deaminase RidA (YjgF/YER057c/UK114 family)